MADLCFLVQHYELAYSCYHTAKKDFLSDQAMLYAAGALVRTHTLICTFSVFISQYYNIIYSSTQASLNKFSIHSFLNRITEVICQKSVCGWCLFILFLMCQWNGVQYNQDCVMNCRKNENFHVTSFPLTVNHITVTVNTVIIIQPFWVLGTVVWKGGTDWNVLGHQRDFIITQR